MIIMQAPTTAAANAGETAINSGTLWGCSVSLAIRSGKYIVMSCQSSDEPKIISNAIGNGWRLIAHGPKVVPSEVLEDDVSLLAYVSGLIDGLAL